MVIYHYFDSSSSSLSRWRNLNLVNGKPLYHAQRPPSGGGNRLHSAQFLIRIHDFHKARDNCVVRLSLY